MWSELFFFVVTGFSGEFKDGVGIFLGFLPGFEPEFKATLDFSFDLETLGYTLNYEGLRQGSSGKADICVFFDGAEVECFSCDLDPKLKGGVPLPNYVLDDLDNKLIDLYLYGTTAQTKTFTLEADITIDEGSGDDEEHMRIKTKDYKMRPHINSNNEVQKYMIFYDPPSGLVSHNNVDSRRTGVNQNSC